MKRKLKHTRGIPINHTRDWSSPLYNVGYGGNKHIKDQKPTISYEQYTNRLRLGKQCNRGDCSKEIVLDPHKKPHFADKTADHRIEILNTNHLKDENVEKLKHQHKVALDGCKNHALNILGDDSDMVRTAEHVLNKRKACLIGKPSDIKTVAEVETVEKEILPIFFVITGRGSILANMDVEVKVKLDSSDGLTEVEIGSIRTSNAGIASVEMDLESQEIDENDILYYILKLVPSKDEKNPSVNTQKFTDDLGNVQQRRTKLVLEYFAKIEANQMNEVDEDTGQIDATIAGGDDAGVADFEITPITNLIYTLFDKVGDDGLVDSITAILGPDINEEKLKLGNNGQQAELKIDEKKRIAMFDIILKKATVMETSFWEGGNGSITDLLEDIGSTLLDKYILNLDSSSPIAEDIHKELQTIYHILDVSADKLDSEDINDDDWDDITNTISQIVVNGSYKHNGTTKTDIYDATSGRSPETNIFDVSTDFGFLDHEAFGGSGTTNVDYGWRDVSTM